MNYNKTPDESTHLADSLGTSGLLPSPVQGEWFDIKVYRDNELVYDDAQDDVISFSIEYPITSERAEAKIRFDGEKVTPTTMSENDAIEIYICTNTGSTIGTKVFSGEIVEITRVREEGEPYLDVIAHDWSKLLSENKVNLSYPTVTNVSTIATDIVSAITTTSPPEPNQREITVNGVDTIQKTRTIDFVGLTMYEALAKLSDYTLCDFYVDPDKDLNFFLRGSRDSGVTLTEEDLDNYEYVTNREVCNYVKVFGASNRTDPEFDLDAYSESLEGWNSYATGGGGMVTIEKTPGTYNTLTYSWTHNTAYSEQTQNLRANSFVNQDKEWRTYGTSPWLHNEAEDYDWIYIYATDPSGSKIDYWDFENLSSPFSNVKEWKEITLKFQVSYFTMLDGRFWYAPCENEYEFTSLSGNYSIGEGGKVGKRLKFNWGESGNGGHGDKQLIFGTSNLRIFYYYQVTSPIFCPDGQKLYLMAFMDQTGKIIVEMELEKNGSNWDLALRGWDKNNSQWKVYSSVHPSSYTWHYVYLQAMHVGTTSTSFLLYDIDSGTTLVSKTGVDTTGSYVKKVSVRGLIDLYDESVSIYYDEIQAYCTARKLGAKARLYKNTQGDYVDVGTFQVDDNQTSWTWKDINIKSFFSYPTDEVLNNLNNMRLWLETASYLNESESGANGQLRITAAKVFVKADCYYGEGNPWIADDDGDQDYIEVVSPDGAEDRAYTNFGFLLDKFTSLVSMEVRVKARNVNGDATATIKPMIFDAQTSSWIELSALSWSPSETTYSTKTVNATSAINTGNVRYKIEHLQLGFKKIGATGKIRITYATVKVTYMQAESYLNLDSAIKKAGNYSIKLYWGGENGIGTLDTYLWRDFTSPIACQTVTCKEGFTELVFAALIDMSVWSSLDYWKRPQAKLKEFTVFLYDSSDNKIKYSAGDLYPVNSFTAIPGPEETKMKEIHVPVGSNAEADGKWEMVEGTYFNWKEVVTVEFEVIGSTDISVEGNPYLEYLILWIDWLHWEGGRWYAEYELDESSPSVVLYGRSYQEIFDKTCFSTEDCEMKAKYYVEMHKYPTDSLEDVEVDYRGMESLNPGETISFQLPEGTLSLRINKITWIWDGDIYGKLDLDNEGIQPPRSTCPSSGEYITNSEFNNQLDSWEHSSNVYVVAGGCPPFYYAVLPYANEYIKQDIQQIKGTSIPEGCISSFKFRARQHECPPVTVRVTITYSDSTTSYHDFLVDSYSFTEYDILPYVTAGKRVSKIEFKSQDNSIDIDYISLVV